MGVDRRILFEGELVDVISQLSTYSRRQLEDIVVSLPDWHVRPFSYSGQDITALLIQLERARRDGKFTRGTDR